MILADVTVVEPDLVYLEAAGLGRVSDRAIEGPPTLAIEVLSPTTAAADRGVKLQLSAKYGVPHYWIVDPRQRHVEVYRMLEDPTAPRTIARESFTWTPVAGGPTLEVDVPELFSELDELTRRRDGYQ